LSGLQWLCLSINRAQSITQGQNEGAGIFDFLGANSNNRDVPSKEGRAIRRQDPPDERLGDFVRGL
jgi:hypothetical protein